MNNNADTLYMSKIIVGESDLFCLHFGCAAVRLNADRQKKKCLRRIKDFHVAESLYDIRFCIQDFTNPKLDNITLHSLYCHKIALVCIPSSWRFFNSVTKYRSLYNFKENWRGMREVWFSNAILRSISDIARHDTNDSKLQSKYLWDHSSDITSHSECGLHS